MRKSLLALFLVFGIVSVGFAQMQKGSWMLDGLVGLSIDKSNSTHQSVGYEEYNQMVSSLQVDINAGIGYFIKDNLALGFAPVFGPGWTTLQDQESQIRINSLTYGMGLFSRKYIPVSEKWSFYGELRADLAKTTRKNRLDGSDEKTDGVNFQAFAASANVGIQYLLSPHFGILLQSSLLDYRVSKYVGGEDEPDYSGENTDLEVGVFTSFQVGASFFF